MQLVTLNTHYMILSKIRIVRIPLRQNVNVLPAILGPKTIFPLQVSLE